MVSEKQILDHKRGLTTRRVSNLPLFKRLFNVFLLRISMSGIWKSTFRAKILRLTGMNVGKSHIGQEIIFDSLHPEFIEIGNNCAITFRCVVVTHYVTQKKGAHYYSYGRVKIGNNVFIGAHSIICQPVTIGDDVVIAAGSVVTKNIPSGEIWGGVPARFIKKVEGYE